MIFQGYDGVFLLEYLVNHSIRPFGVIYNGSDTKRHVVFDFRKEMDTYCRSDVDILKRACLQFRKLMLDATEVDPFQYVTIASVCVGIFKTR